MNEATLRLFVAIYPPAADARAMLRALHHLRLPSHRQTPVEQLHLTLQFIGEVERRDLPAIIESVERSASGLEVFSLRPERLITLPERGRPRLVAARTDAPPTLLELQRRLATRLARHPRERAGSRFTPHFTLCRFTHSANPCPIDEALTLPSFRIEQVHLVKSVLMPEGAEHSPVHQVELPG